MRAGQVGRPRSSGIRACYGALMGDKSPKAKNKAKKQDTKEKDDKKAAAAEKAKPKDPNANKKK